MTNGFASVTGSSFVDPMGRRLTQGSAGSNRPRRTRVTNWLSVLDALSKDEVPAGTEVWSSDG